MSRMDWLTTRQQPSRTNTGVGGKMTHLKLPHETFHTMMTSRLGDFHGRSGFASAPQNRAYQRCSGITQALRPEPMARSARSPDTRRTAHSRTKFQVEVVARLT